MFYLACFFLMFSDLDSSLDGFSQQGLEVVVAEEDFSKAWGRGQGFIHENSNLKIQVSTDYIIETYNPIEIGHIYYSMVRKDLSDGQVKISVNVICKGCTHEFVMVKAKRFAWYIRTAEEFWKELPDSLLMTKMINHRIEKETGVKFISEVPSCCSPIGNFKHKAESQYLGIRGVVEKATAKGADHVRFTKTKPGLFSYKAWITGYKCDCD